MGDAVWFYWPVTTAVVTGLNVRSLVRRRAATPAAMGVLSAGILIVPLMLTMRVRCADDGQDLDALIGNGYVLGACLLLAVAWLAILNRLRVSFAGAKRAEADRTTLWSLGFIVLIAPIEAVMSFSSMEAHCTGDGGFRAAHLAVAVAVLMIGTASRRVEEAGI